jgi:hypothetical protein
VCVVVLVYMYVMSKVEVWSVGRSSRLVKGRCHRQRRVRFPGSRIAGALSQALQVAISLACDATSLLPPTARTSNPSDRNTPRYPRQRQSQRLGPPQSRSGHTKDLEIRCVASPVGRLWFCAVAVADLVRACHCIAIFGQRCMVAEQE